MRLLFDPCSAGACDDLQIWSDNGRTPMVYRRSLGATAKLVLLLAMVTAAHAFDEAPYPDWRGVWQQLGGSRDSPWDPSKPAGAGQQAPLTPEYRAIYETTVKNEAEGGLEADPIARCIPAGFPRVMIATLPMEIVISPDATYFMLQQFSTLRRVYTDGRRFPDDFELSYTGYSIGQWQDTDGDGKYDTLVIETRGIKGPHTYDTSGTPFHQDSEAVVTEKLYADKNNPNILHDEITTIDHGLSRPWTVTRSYSRAGPDVLLEWSEFLCTADDTRIEIADQIYKLSPEGLLMPVRKGQKPPDLRYFK
jgi:hypothetical protein